MASIDNIDSIESNSAAINIFAMFAMFAMSAMFAMFARLRTEMAGEVVTLVESSSSAWFPFSIQLLHLSESLASISARQIKDLDRFKMIQV